MVELFTAAKDILARTTWDKIRPHHTMSKRRSMYVAQKELSAWSDLFYGTNIYGDFTRYSEITQQLRIRFQTKTPRGQVIRVAEIIHHPFRQTSRRIELSSQEKPTDDQSYVASGVVEIGRKRGKTQLQATFSASVKQNGSSRFESNTPYAVKALQKVRQELTPSIQRNANGVRATY